MIAAIPAHAAAPAAGYVDASRCASCHADIARKYAATAMARSFSRPAADKGLADFAIRNTFSHAASARSYTMIARGGEYFERRNQTGFDGKESNILEKRIDFVIGSGDRARTFLHRSPRGALIELPVSWYAENGGYWAMSPGYDRPRHDDFLRPVPYECMFCHNAYPAGLESFPGGADAAFPATLPSGIDCQRCHGPGRAHIEAASSGRDPETVRRAIVNPARLPRERALEVCMQCHLETTSRRLPNSVRRFARTPFSYRPGEPLANYMLCFDRAPQNGHDDDFEVAHQAYRLRKSACFLKSAMTCTTCHDPHARQSGPEAAVHYIAVCRGCHAAAHSHDTIATSNAAANCIDCHMPKRRAEDAVHVVLTDHYIQRNKPARDLTAPIAEQPDAPYRGEVFLYYPQSPSDDLYLAVAQVRDGANLTRGIPRLAAAIARFKPAAPEFEFELGAAYEQAGKTPEAIRQYREALLKRPAYESALVKLTGQLVSTGNFTLAAETASRSIAAHPRDVQSLTNLGNIRLHQSRPGDAIAFLDRALALDPDRPEARNLVGLAELKRNNPPAAEAAFREAIRINPDFAEAHNNLGNLLAARRDFPQAGYEFQQAIAANPASIEAYRSFSLVLALNGRPADAVATLRKALAIAPDSAEAHLDLADLLDSSGGPGEAEREYREALRIKPSLAEAHLGLGVLLMRSGRAAEARPHLEQAARATDPDTRAAALKALN